MHLPKLAYVNGVTEIWPKMWFCKGHDIERSRSYVKITGTTKFRDLQNIDLDTTIVILSALVQKLLSNIYRMMILVSRHMFLCQEIRWCHSFWPMTLTFRGYDLCKVMVASICSPIYEYEQMFLFMTLFSAFGYQETGGIHLFHC